MDHGRAGDQSPHGVGEPVTNPAATEVADDDAAGRGLPQPAEQPHRLGFIQVMQKQRAGDDVGGRKRVGQHVVEKELGSAGSFLVTGRGAGLGTGAGRMLDGGGAEIAARELEVTAVLVGV